jgi:hypothetical protein
MNIVIPKGKQWGEPTINRIQYNIPPLSTKNEHRWVCSVDFGSCPVGTSIKLVGLCDVYLQTLWKFTHYTSDRFVAIKTKEGVDIRSYGYRKGNGPATTGKSYSRKIKTVQENSEFLLYLKVTPTGATYRVNHTRDTEFRNGKSCIHTYTWPHAKGYQQPYAPEDIHLKIQHL